MRMTLALMGAATLLVLVGIGSRVASDPRRPPISLRRPGTIRVVKLPAPPNTLNPLLPHNAAADWFDQQMYDSLVRIDRGRLRPDLAVKWRVEDGGRRVQVWLSPEAKWWNGRPVTARDVAWSYMVKRTEFARRFPLLARLRPTVTTITPLRLTIHLARPDPAFLRQAATRGPYGWILPAHLLRHATAKALATTPYLTRPLDMVGTGPYQTVLLTTKIARLEVNPHYFLGPPKIRTLVVHFPPGSGKTAAAGARH